MLHNAMEKLLLEAGRPLKASEIAEQINLRRLYRKRDGSPLQPNQVSARARKYPGLFIRVPGAVSLTRWGGSQPLAETAPSAGADVPASRSKAASTVSPFGSAELDAALFDATAFRPAGTIDLEVPDRPGLYAIRVRDKGTLPEPFKSHSEKRGHDLIYVGIASQSLNRRFLGQELRARGNGTFFRSIGAVLGFRPLPGSLIGRSNTRNFTFTATDNLAIIEWINARLLVNWIEFSGAHAVEESALIRKYLPLLNLQGNPSALPELSALRAECVRIANLDEA